MRKLSVILIALCFALAFQVGSAFADSKLEETVKPLLGINYKSGGSTTNGFDCSGFTQYVFKKLGISLNRSSRDQAIQGKKVSRDNLRPGDLVFFNTNGKSISHVGIYVGDGKFVHSPSTGKSVSFANMDDKYYAQRFVTARRVMDADTYQEIATDPSDAPESDNAPADDSAE
ncbi:NlpC/P60 family protein [Cohnella endophytica]|uniref:NlpC/P60 family protein n=1 Tax=Cohnella endophytica TaxID=2419778 RepID=A0A494XBZ4_9BACL|nr:C40 family peptidase [Cohnella endophytica]RKP48038.1 NlpC/P60 family protein [Cohnella endophytica]